MRAGMPGRQAGTELVEFAITAMLLFMLLFGIIEFSVVMFDKATITNASREGARTGILFRPEPRDAGTEDAIVTTAINDYAAAYLISLGGAAALDVDVGRTDLNGDGVFNSGDEITVTVTYPYQFLILPGFVTSMAGELGLSATTVMRAE